MTSAILDTLKSMCHLSRLTQTWSLHVKHKALHVILQQELEPPSFPVRPKCPISTATLQNKGWAVEPRVEPPPPAAILQTSKQPVKPRGTLPGVHMHTHSALSPHPRWALSPSPLRLPHNTTHEYELLDFLLPASTTPQMLPQIKANPATPHI